MANVTLCPNDIQRAVSISNIHYAECIDSKQHSRCEWSASLYSPRIPKMVQYKLNKLQTFSENNLDKEIWCDFDRASSLICGILQTGRITLSSKPDQLLEKNHSTKYHKQQPVYNTLELLMMGIVMPETCWASYKICNKNLCCTWEGNFPKWRVKQSSTQNSVFNCSKRGVHTEVAHWYAGI